MLYIRTDADHGTAPERLTGCLAIAEELRRRGECSVFLLTGPDMAEPIGRSGFQAIVLDHLSSPESEAERLVPLLKKEKAAKLLVDLPRISAGYFESLNHAAKLIYLGTQEQVFPGIHLLINYSNACRIDFYSEAYCACSTKLLLGVRYLPLRKEFRELRPIVRDRVKNILMPVGGAAETSPVGRLAEDLSSAFPNLNFILAAEFLNRGISSLEKQASRLRNVELVANPENMAAVMRNCDAAVSACGMHLYELCACGTPTVCFALTAEQSECGKQFHFDRITAYAGDLISNYGACLFRITARLKSLTENNSLRRETAVRMNSYLDGFGSQRIAEEILKLN
ncbi:hypothetical protein CAFE_05590 [Caprobacter fermentans]|uniref:Uncharacterized protein n=1 Tax=Caproicibacter fermentans TaxID=2576756 RepID=A0A6N8HVY6_9FIRM|nr:hypothetical protein [Caproicibacter fermentans]MVB09892.1 hypothetical protein [Caproicibacter fermentans]OCN00325.1 hypothetical protein A7X67_09720 [Clostridium sp. W14A]